MSDALFDRVHQLHKGIADLESQARALLIDLQIEHSRLGSEIQELHERAERLRATLIRSKALEPKLRDEPEAKP